MASFTSQLALGMLPLLSRQAATPTLYFFVFWRSEPGSHTCIARALIIQLPLQSPNCSKSPSKEQIRSPGFHQNPPSAVDLMPLLHGRTREGLTWLWMKSTPPHTHSKCLGLSHKRIIQTWGFGKEIGSWELCPNRQQWTHNLMSLLRHGGN